MPMSGVKVSTDGDNFASIEYNRAIVELSKDGDSPSCPNSWTWTLYFDGCGIDGCEEEMSLAECVKDATMCLIGIADEIKTVVNYLKAYGAVGEVQP